MLLELKKIRKHTKISHYKYLMKTKMTARSLQQRWNGEKTLIESTRKVKIAEAGIHPKGFAKSNVLLIIQNGRSTTNVSSGASSSVINANLKSSTNVINIALTTRIRGMGANPYNPTHPLYVARKYN
jgi:hypothetical protein